MVIRELLKSTVDALRDGGNDNAVFEANIIMRDVLMLSPLDLVLKARESVQPIQQKKASEIVQRRLSGEPLQYILGTQEFMSLEFSVTPDVLIPRADTEALVEHILKKKLGQGMSLLDIGTGSGCIALSVAHYNKRAFVRGVDISTGALAVAYKNAEKLKLTKRAIFDEADILNDSLYGRYDVIVSNPPYIETAQINTLDEVVKAYEPHTALDGGEDGLKFYRKIVTLAPQLLNPRGLLAFEVGYTQARAVASLMEKNFEKIEILPDLCGVERVVSGTKKISGG